MIKGYARVSTDGQDLATQHELLKAAGAQLVFSEKQSGIKTDRAALARLMASLEPGDVVLVTKLDRLARSTRDLLNTLATIGEAGASFKSLGDPWADTTTPHGRLMLTVLGGLAEFERHLILSRTNEGRVRAKARGVRFGRKPKLTKHQQAEALARIARGETLTAIARSLQRQSHDNQQAGGCGHYAIGPDNLGPVTKDPGVEVCFRYAGRFWNFLLSVGRKNFEVPTPRRDFFLSGLERL